jgi:protein TonB
VNQRRSSFVVISVAAHAVLLLALVATSILAPGLLPAPQRVLAYYNADRLVKVEDIDLPASKRPRGPATSRTPNTSAPTTAAPVEAPEGIAPETGLEDAAAGARSDLAAIEQGRGSVDGVGMPETPPPSPPREKEPVRLHAGIQAPRKVVDVAPVYPELARATRVQGIVILEVVIDEHGDVGSARVLRSTTLLDQAALDAVRRWKFAPARLNGEAIPVVMTVTVNFTLSP